jgi:hypothetical protein
MKKLPDNQIAFYKSPDGSVNIEVLYAEENIWLTQKKMAELFDTTPQNITQHLKNIYTEGEAVQTATCKDFLQVQKEGEREVKRNTSFYSLEAIIAIGYRVNSERGTQFRQWATEILKSYIHKGYVLDSDRFKYGSRFSARYFDELYEEIKDIRSSERMLYQKITDIYATAIDYSPKAYESKQFFATVQNKLHFAITGKTAAEIIQIRVKKELTELNRIVNMYLDYAEMQAARGRAMTMKDWIEKLNAFLKFSEHEILTNAGNISHEVAEELALKEYEKYRVIQDKKYVSDFDREVKKLLNSKKKKL